MKCGKCKFKINIGNTEETGDAFCSRASSYFPINCKDNCHFSPRKKELYCKDCSRLGRDTACMTAKENDKVYYNGQRCGGFIDKKEDEFTEILQFWKSQGWYKRTKIDRMQHSKNTFDWNRKNIAAFADELVSRKEDLGERIHIIEALQWAQNHSEQIIEVIEGAEDYYDARAKVMETFGFDRIQAQSVTEMRVRTFCEIEKEKLSGELQKFRGKMELFQE